MGDSAEIFAAYNAATRAERMTRRLDAMDQYHQLVDLARTSGLVFQRYTKAHYRISLPGVWRINLYPGNCRVYSDPTKPGPHLNLPMPWTLQQAVEQAIKAHLKRKGKGPS
jgi:hypothetical protein